MHELCHKKKCIEERKVSLIAQVYSWWTGNEPVSFEGQGPLLLTYGDVGAVSGGLGSDHGICVCRVLCLAALMLLLTLCLVLLYRRRCQKNFSAGGIGLLQPL